MFEQAQVVKDFSAAAEEYDTYAQLQQQVLAKLIAKIRHELQPEQRLLDAGCGTGYLRQQLPGYEIVQLDNAYAMCKIAAKNAPAIAGTITSLPFSDSTFDCVISSLALQWVPEWQAALQEMERVLKPCGILAVSTFGPRTLQELKRSFAIIDAHPHVSEFIPTDKFWESEIIIEYYTNTVALMRQLKIIGARNKRQDRRKSLMTGGQLARLEQYYFEYFGTAKGLPVTWEILYSVVIKT